MRRALCCVVLSIAGLSLADSPFVRGQEPAPPTPPPAVSPDTPAAKIEDKPIALTPIEDAERLFALGKFDDAVERYNAIIRSGSDRAVAYAGLSRAYLKLRKPSDAYLAVRKAVESDPSLATAHSALGEVYLRQAKFHEAQTEFMTALKANPADARSYLGLSRLYRASYDFKKAKVAIDKAHSLDASDPDISSAWVDTRSRSEQVKALEDNIASESKYYSRVEKAGFKQRLTLLKDEIEHPERTCEVEIPPERAEMRLTPIGPKGEFMGLEVGVNGAASRLVLSTVSSGIVINRKIAEEAGVQPISRADLDALGEQNPPEAYIGFVRSVKIQDLEFQNCYVTVIEKSSPRSFYDQFEGLIAAGFFFGYLVDVDFPNADLKLQFLPMRQDTKDQESAAMDSGDPDAKNFHDRYIASEMAGWTEMYHFGSAILVPARLNGFPPELFEVTTSSALNVLAPDFAREHASLKPDTRSEHLEGINGRVSGETTGKVKLEFSNLHLNAIRVISFEEGRASDSAETKISGYLGFEMLRNLHIMIDYRDGLIHFAQDRRRERE